MADIEYPVEVGPVTIDLQEEEHDKVLVLSIGDEEGDISVRLGDRVEEACEVIGALLWGFAEVDNRMAYWLTGEVRYGLRRKYPNMPATGPGMTGGQSGDDDKEKEIMLDLPPDVDPESRIGKFKQRHKEAS